MNRIKTVTIGISAHNEEATITKLLEGISEQKGTNFNLKKVIVACDGSTDRTPALCKKFASNSKRVTVIDDGMRLGKAGRLNFFYKTISTDIVVIFDADVKLGSEFVIQNLVSKFEDDRVGLVGGFALPLKPRNYFESIVVAWLDIWNFMRVRINNGEVIHNNLGCVTALSKQLYKKVEIPNTTIPDDDFTYITAKINDFEFKFAKKAVVYYRTVSNIRDFFIQHSRLVFSKKIVSDYFGDWVNELYVTPEPIKFQAIKHFFAKNPVKTLIALLLQVILRFGYFVPKEQYSNGHWQVAISSKLL